LDTIKIWEFWKLTPNLKFSLEANFFAFFRTFPDPLIEKEKLSFEVLIPEFPESKSFFKKSFYCSGYEILFSPRFTFPAKSLT